MKNTLKSIGLAVLVAAIMFSFVSCGGGGAGSSGLQPGGENLVLRGKAGSGENVEITISQDASRAMSPRNNDRYTIRINGNQVSRGRVEINGKTVTFRSDTDGEVYNATLFGRVISMPVVLNGNSTPVIGITMSDTSFDSTDEQVFNVTAADFDSTFKSIRDIPGVYVLNLTDNLIDYAGVYCNNPEVIITIKGTGSNKITWKYDANAISNLFYLGSGHLIVENITLEHSTTNDNDKKDWALLRTEDGMIEIRNGVKLTGIPGSGKAMEAAKSGHLIMRGGEISGWRDGMVIEKGASAVVTGGIIKNNYEKGIWVGDEINSIFVLGGTINDNGCGLEINGGGNTVLINGGRFIDNDKGIGIDCYSANISKNTITFSGGEISGNEAGVVLEGPENFFKMTGGVIKGSTLEGLNIIGGGFEKTGGIIYGIAEGANSNGGVGNGGRSISLTKRTGPMSWENMRFISRTSGTSDVLAAKLDSTGNGIASITGNWD